MEGILKIWAGSKTDRQMNNRFWLRRMTDKWVSHSLPPETHILIAPSCAAELTFAAAAQRNIKKILIEDLPAIRQLQEDLDRAARAHPQSQFLKRYRSSLTSIHRQEREWVMADFVWLRGNFARELKEKMGFPISSILDLPLPPINPDEIFQPPTQPQREVLIQTKASKEKTRHILLAGLATARSGIREALSILETRPHLILYVKTGEGMEPKDILSHPQVRAISQKSRKSLKDIDLVIAPAWCESYPPEVAQAAAMGIPIIATKQACGFVNLNHAGEEIEPGNSNALAEAIDRWLLKKKPVFIPLPNGMSVKDEIFKILN